MMHGCSLNKESGIPNHKFVTQMVSCSVTCRKPIVSFLGTPPLFAIHPQIYADDCLEQQEYMRAVEYCTLAIEQRSNDANLYIHRYEDAPWRA
jgi:hypothetical protein